MVIISEKGRILELSSIIDLILILITLSLITGMALMFNPPAANPVSCQAVEVTVVVHLVPVQTAQLIQANDYLIAGNNKVLVKSTEIRPVTNEGGAANSALKDIYVTLKGQSTISEGIINLGGQEISLGRSYHIITANYKLRGIVTGITFH